MATFPKETLENIVLDNIPNNTQPILEQIRKDDVVFYNKLTELFQMLTKQGYTLRRLSNYRKHYKWVDVSYGSYHSVTFTVTKVSHPTWRNNFHIGDLGEIVKMVCRDAEK